MSKLGKELLRLQQESLQINHELQTLTSKLEFIDNEMELDIHSDVEKLSKHLTDIQAHIIMLELLVTKLRGNK